MTIRRLEHIGIVVDDLVAATAFFAALGLEVEGETSVEGDSVDRIPLALVPRCHRRRRGCGGYPARWPALP